MFVASFAAACGALAGDVDRQQRAPSSDGAAAATAGSGVNPNIFWGAIKAPKAPRGRGTVPSPEIFFDFGSQNGDLWCILGAIFCSSAKTLTGRLDTLAQVYFYWGRGNRPPAPPPGSTPLTAGSDTLRYDVLFCSLPRSEGWPHHRRTFSIYLCPLSF